MDNPLDWGWKLHCNLVMLLEGVDQEHLFLGILFVKVALGCRIGALAGTASENQVTSRTIF